MSIIFKTTRKIGKALIILGLVFWIIVGSSKSPSAMAVMLTVGTLIVGALIIFLTPDSELNENNEK